MPIIAGIAFIGGILILLMTSNDEDSDKENESDDKQSNNSPEGEKVDVEKIRSLRRELRHQLSKKKKISNKPPTKQ
jgi:hypothetical protein